MAFIKHSIVEENVDGTCLFCCTRLGRAAFPYLHHFCSQCRRQYHTLAARPLNLNCFTGEAKFKHQQVLSARDGSSQAFLQRGFPTNYCLISAAQLFRWSLNPSRLPPHLCAAPWLPACPKIKGAIDISESSG